MTLKLDAFSKSLARAAAVIVVAAGASACSSVPDWVDPTTWIGGDDKAASQTPDETAAENAPTPDIASVPNKPAPASTPDEQKQVADSLNADKASTEYSGDALRGGTEASAPPPPDAPPPEQIADTSASSPSPNAAPSGEQSASLAQAPSSASTPATPDQSPPPAAAPTPAPAPAPSTATASGGQPAVPAVPNSPPAAAPSAVASNSAPPAAAPTTRVAMAETPAAVASSGGGLPAVPANGGSVAAFMPAQADSDAALGFQHSSAPPLDPSIGQFVPASILSRYQETASVGGAPGIKTGAVSADSSGYTAMNTSAPAVGATSPAPAVGRAMGGPEQMTGAVVANFDSLQGPQTPSVSSDTSGLPPSAVVFFPRDTTILNAGARDQIRSAVQAYQASGGQGYIRVVGHASSGAASMSMQRRMIWNFERSQQRAKAVAQELIRDGIPASKVLVEAVGDTEPATYTAVPEGEDGSRRAEIFFQT